MKRFMLTVALTCTLSVLTRAGEMPTAGVTTQTPPRTLVAATEPDKAPASPPAETAADETVGILDMLILAIITWR